MLRPRAKRALISWNECVMTGLDPAIHDFLPALPEGVGARTECAHDARHCPDSLNLTL